MARNRDLNLDKYNIGRFAYRELLYFCLQYPDKKQKAAAMLGTRSQALTGLPGGNGINNTTAAQAEMRDKLLKDCELIEQTAAAIDSVWYQQLIYGITNSVSWHELRLCKGLGMGEKEYQKKRRHFFYLLAEKKKII